MIACKFIKLHENHLILKNLSPPFGELFCFCSPLLKGDTALAEGIL